MTVRVLRSAAKDMAAGRAFYDRQSPGVGDRFIDAVLAEFDDLILYAGIHRKKFGFYFVKVRRFPYGIYYLVERNEATVLHVLDSRRDPNWIRRALRRS